MLNRKKLQIEIIINNNVLKTLYRNIARLADVHLYRCMSPICFPRIPSGTGH